MSRSWIERTFLASSLAVLLTAGAAAAGPLVLGTDPAVAIYRDFDDGLFGRSVYRGVVFSVKLEAFDRYRSLRVEDVDGLTAYLVSADRARSIAAGRALGTTRIGSARPGAAALPDGDPEKWAYAYERKGIRIAFALERAPDDLYEEIARTYRTDTSVAATVSDSYRAGYVVRVLTAENVYRPQFARIDYEDVLVSAALIGDDFQPLWGIHDGNALTSSDF